MSEVEETETFCCTSYRNWVLGICIVMLVFAAIDLLNFIPSIITMFVAFGQGYIGIAMLSILAIVVYIVWVVCAILGLLATTCFQEKKNSFMIGFLVITLLNLILAIVYAVIVFVSIFSGNATVLGFIFSLIRVAIDFFIFFVGYKYRGGIGC